MAKRTTKKKTTGTNTVKEVNGWELQKHGNQFKLVIGGMSGINVIAQKHRNSLQIGGWYDGIVGIQGQELKLPDILQLLGKKDEINKLINRLEKHIDQLEGVGDIVWMMSLLDKLKFTLFSYKLK
jgi:hypothetical protein